MHMVDDFDPESGFFFGTATRSLLSGGAAIVLPGRGPLAPARAEAVLSALGPDQILVGALPFDNRSAAQLIVPEWHRWGPALDGEPDTASPRPAQYTLEPSPQHYLDAVSHALHRIEHTELSKVVLARSISVELPEPADPVRILRRLRHRHSGGFVFACPVPGGNTLVGGSPELLVSRNGDTVSAHPLAGSRPRSHDPETDRQRRSELLASTKDRFEHALVVDHIARTLEPYCSSLTAPSTPEIVSTPHMLHLGTRITGTLRDPLPSVLALAGALHPTPAVCGTPTDSARDAITALEGFSRGFYAGTVGWCDAAGDGQWAVTIRCAEVGADRARLFAGAGIVSDSKPQSELDETEAKMSTMLTALGLHIEEETGDRHLHTVA